MAQTTQGDLFIVVRLDNIQEKSADKVLNYLKTHHKAIRIPYHKFRKGEHHQGQLEIEMYYGGGKVIGAHDKDIINAVWNAGNKTNIHFWMHPIRRRRIGVRRDFTERPIKHRV